MIDTRTDPEFRPHRDARRLPLEGARLRELVHYASTKEPEAELHLEDGRVIKLSIGDLEFVSDTGVRVTMRYNDDSSYIARYTCGESTLESVEIGFGDPDWQNEFNNDVDRWVAGGYADELHCVVDARIALRAA